MAQDSDLLNKDKLDKDAQALAAKILRRDRSGRIKKVKVEIKRTIKTEKNGKQGGEEKTPKDNKNESGKRGDQEPGQKSGADKEPEKEGEDEKNKQGEKKPGEKKSDAESDKADEEKSEGEGQGGEKRGEKEPGQKSEAEQGPEEKGEGKEESKKESEDEGEGEKKLGEKQPGGESGKPNGENRGESGEEGKKPEWQAGGRTKESDSLDNELLENSAEEQTAAGELRKKKKNELTSAEEESGDEPQSLRQRVTAARQAMNLKEQAKKKIEEKILSPIKQGSRRALQKAWLSFTTVIGAILGILYINLHVLLKWIFGEKLFCKLGDEWLPPQATQAAGEGGKVITKSAGLVEVMLLIFIDTIIFIIIIAFVAMFVDEGTFKAMTGEVNKTQPVSAVQQTK